MEDDDFNARLRRVEEMVSRLDERVKNLIAQMNMIQKFGVAIATALAIQIALGFMRGSQ